MAKSKITESERLFALTEIERGFWSQGNVVLAGMDEVGRGPLAGPVVTACVVLPETPLIEGINDSKKLSEKKREVLYERIVSEAVAYATAWVEPVVIDQINIAQATKQAFEQAFRAVNEKCAVTDVLVDYVKDLNLEANQHAFVHGDARSYLIGAASIVAKVERDRYMQQQDALYPEYGFARNKGYGTKEHIAALEKYGPCPLHRRSFITRILKEDEA